LLINEMIYIIIINAIAVNPNISGDLSFFNVGGGNMIGIFGLLLGICLIVILALGACGV